MPGRTGDYAWSVLLLFEAAEGGAGVLRRLATEQNPIRQVARRAIALMHYDPDTLAELGWLVLRFHHEDNRTTDCGTHPSWASLIKANPNIFGPGKTAL